MATAARAIYELANKGTAAVANTATQALISGKEIATSGLKTGEAVMGTVRTAANTVRHVSKSGEILAQGSQNIATGATHVFKSVEQGLNIMKKQLEKKNIRSKARLQAFEASLNQFKQQEQNKLKRNFERHQYYMQKNQYKTDTNRLKAELRFKQSQQEEIKRSREERKKFYQSQIQESLKEYRVQVIELFDTLSRLFCDYKLTQNIGVYKCKYFPNFNTKTFKSRVYHIKESYLLFLNKIETKLMNTLRTSSMSNEYENFNKEFIGLTKHVIEVNEYIIGKISNIQNIVMFTEGVNMLKNKVFIELEDMIKMIQLKSEQVYSLQTFYVEPVVNTTTVSLPNENVKTTEIISPIGLVPGQSMNNGVVSKLIAHGKGMNPLGEEVVGRPIEGGKRIKKKRVTRKTKKTKISKK